MKSIIARKFDDAHFKNWMKETEKRAMLFALRNFFRLIFKSAPKMLIKIGRFSLFLPCRRRAHSFDLYS